MSKALSYLEELERATANVEKAVNKIPKLRKELSKMDKRISDAYHTIENFNFNARDGYGAYKNLQNILRRRRIIKGELDALERIANQAQIKRYSTSIKNTKTTVATAHDKAMGWRKSKWDIEVDDVVKGIYDEVQ